MESSGLTSLVKVVAAEKLEDDKRAVKYMCGYVWMIGGTDVYKCLELGLAGFSCV